MRMIAEEMVASDVEKAYNTALHVAVDEAAGTSPTRRTAVVPHIGPH